MILHVANGSATTRLIDASGVPGRTMSWADALYDGPVPDVADAELDRIRARHHAATEADLERIAAEFASWRAAVDDTASYDELVLWYEHDLFDQLNLIHLLSHLGHNQALLKPVTLISIDRHASKPDFKGIGELSPPDVAALFDARQPVHEAQIVLARRAWRAFRAADPRAVEALLRDDTSALPYLAAALRRHLEEFPSERNGLSKSEQRLMELAAAGVDASAAWRRMHEGEGAYYITDTTFADLVRELTNTSPPLLTPALTLTSEGEAVLAGRFDRVRLCGIDRWLGGVHLSGDGPVWRWNPALRSMQLS